MAARDTLTVITLAAYGGKDEDTSDSFTTGTGANDLQFVHPGGDVLVYINNTVASPISTTVVGVASPRTFNRAVDITVATAASKASVVGIPSAGFNQGGGVVHMDFTDDTTEYAVYKITPTPNA